MFSKNLRYYRLKKGLTKKELAELVHLTPMAITHYENGSRAPSMAILNDLAGALDIRISDFLANWNNSLSFSHGSFWKNTSLSGSQQEAIQSGVEEYFQRFFSVLDILGGDVLPEAPKYHALPLSKDDETNAQALREHLGFADFGPIYNLTNALENQGILLCYLNMDNDKFSGINGLVNHRPYIAVNENMSPERIRSTLVHELAHLYFIWPESMQEKEIEAKATAIAGAFLFSQHDAIRELGYRRLCVSADMVLVAQEYGISMWLLAKRAQLSHIIRKDAEQHFYVKSSESGWRKNEPTRIQKERPLLLKQFVYRAIAEGDISIQRGAELLNKSYDEVAAYCSFSED